MSTDAGDPVNPDAEGRDDAVRPRPACCPW